jgi:hypothetical protein
MNTKLYIGLLASSLLAVAALEGCGSDTGTGTGGSTNSTTSDASSSASGTGGDASSTSSGTGGAPQTPAPPKLGAQIDRFGRPAINTALNHVFDADPAKQGTAKDAYNQQSDPATWAASGAEFSKNLALLDGIDTICGNQILAPATLTPDRYAGLAGALANDRIFVDTSAGGCSTYLAVEANFTQLAPNMDGGGRKLDYDVIDTSYTYLASGLAGAKVGDGVSADADTKGTAFPYLAAPH